MAVKRAVFDVDVKDERFKQFLTSFEKYEKKLATLPGLSGAVGKETANTVKSVQLMTAVMMANMDVMRRQKKEQNEAANASSRMAAAWAVIDKHSRTTASTLHKSVTTLMRWTGIAGAISGLAFGGSVWGLDRLAAQASAGRRSATGRGLSYGEQTAFGVTYDRLLDSASFLGGVSTARGNVASGAAGALFSLGIDPSGGGNTANMANNTLSRIRQLALQTPDSQLGILHSSRGLGELGLSMEDLRRIKGLSSEEFSQYQGEYSKRAGQLEVTDATLKRWQDFYVQLDTAGEKIKSALIVGLEALTKPLADLSEGLSDFIRSLVDSGGLKTAVDWVAKHLQAFADYIGGDKFKTDLKLFVNSIAMLAEKLVNALRWLNLIPDPNAPATPAEPKTLKELRPEWFKKEYGPPAPTGSQRTGSTAQGFTGGIVDWFKGLPWLPDKNRVDWGTSGSAGMEAYKKAIAGIESSHLSNPYGAQGPMVKGDRAYGKYQVMGANIPGWTKEALGQSLTPEQFLADPSAQEKVFEHKFGEYLKKYGNYNDAASMWHSGVPLNQAIREGRRDINMSTEEYVRRSGAGIPGNQRVEININNNTGGNAVVTTSAMGANNT